MHYEKSIYSNHIILCLPEYQRADNQPVEQSLSRKRRAGEKTNRGEGLKPERHQGRLESGRGRNLRRILRRRVHK